MDKPTDHSDRDHAEYAPSGAGRWLVCTKSIEMSQGIESRSSVWAEEGTECHEAAADILTGLRSFEAATADLSDDQTWIVEEYTEWVFGLIDRLQNKFDDVKVWVESRVRSGFSPKFHGTADNAILANRTLAINDLKAGFVAVSPDHPQLKSYAILFLDHYNLWDDVDAVRLTIFQPRVYDKPVTAVISINDLGYFKIKVIETINAIEKGKTKLEAGDHCKYCPARGRCPELRTKAVDKARFVFDEPKAAQLYEPDELVAILNEAEMIQTHIDGVRAHVMRELEKGRMKGLGYKLVPKRATSKWTDWQALEAKLIQSGASEIFNFKPKTPLQLEKSLKKQNIEFDLSGYFVKESSGPTLARADDPREEYVNDVFGENK